MPKSNEDQLSLNLSDLPATKRRSALRKGQYLICKYKGSNGDLIVGCVQSVRTNGDVILTNLLSDQRSTKHEDVLSRRNLVVSKLLAMRVVYAYRDALLAGKTKNEARSAARQEAVRVARTLMDSPPRRRVSQQVKELVKAVKELSEEDFNDFSKAVWGDVLQHFGVQ